MTDLNSSKQLILDYFAAVEKSTSQNITETVSQFIADDYHWYGVYPFEEQSDAQGVADAFWKPFLDAWSPISRRQDVFMGGTSEIDGSQWVTSMGHFQGLFDKDWLGIPATGKMAFLRYAEFHNVKDGKIVRSSFFCDIIGVMHQAGINPLPMQTGASVTVPGPKTSSTTLQCLSKI